MNNERKFDVIKKYATDEFLGKVQLGAPSPSEAQFLALVAAAKSAKPVDARKLLADWVDEGMRMIDAWDVRMVGKLIECFPGCVPKHWKGRKLSVWMADNKNCDWMVGIE